MANEEYLARYDELKNLLVKAYCDVYALQEIERYNKSVQNGGSALLKNSFNALEHICELLKADMGLTVWKMFSDENKKANTVRSLCRYLHKLPEAESLNLKLPKLTLPHELRTAERQLCSIRKNFLAHNDISKAYITIKIDDIVKILHCITDIMNALCFTQIDESAKPLTEQEQKAIQFNISFGLGLMINRSTFLISK